jgi:hypothetical protein
MLYYEEGKIKTFKYFLQVEIYIHVNKCTCVLGEETCRITFNCYEKHNSIQLNNYTN